MASILAVALVCQAGAITPARSLLGSTSFPAEEEPDSRQLPVEEEAKRAIGSPPNRGYRILAASGVLVLPRTALGPAQQYRPPVDAACFNEHAARNGMGGPLRC